MRIWKDTIKQEQRKKASTRLKEKLFILHDTFRKHLMTHRDYCIKMEELRFFDLGSNLETQTIKEFAKFQAKTRADIKKRIEGHSTKWRENVNACINKVIQDLKFRIDAETKLDEERRRVVPIQNTTTLALKDKPTHNVFEELGFPPGMTYGHWSSLREECSRFIRFWYLIDFMSLESLTGIYLGSVEGITSRLRYLDNLCNEEEIMTMDLSDANGPPAAPVRGHDPLFLVKLELQTDVQIPDSEIVKVEIDDFKPPPHGTSEVKDFDLLSHLELEPEVDPNAKDGEESDNQADQLFEKKYKEMCPNIHKLWLTLSPSRTDFEVQFEKIFHDCRQWIKAFERFSKHPSMKIYADALEEWDDRIGENWETPDDLFLDPIEWIKGNKIYMDQSTNVRLIFSSSFDKTEKFTERFREILQMYWINQKVDLNIIVHERLKNPTDSLQHVINLFIFQDDLFSTGIPTSTNLGLMKLDSK